MRLAGLEVGNIEDISFSSDASSKKIIVKLSIDKEYSDRIRKDSVVSIKTLGLLGDKYVDISVGTPSQPEMLPGGALKDVNEAQIAGVLSGAATGLEGLNVVIGQLKDVMGDISQRRRHRGYAPERPKALRGTEQLGCDAPCSCHRPEGGQGQRREIHERPASFTTTCSTSRTRPESWSTG